MHLRPNNGIAQKSKWHFFLEYAESCASMQGEESIRTHTTAINKKKRKTNFWGFCKLEICAHTHYINYKKIYASPANYPESSQTKWSAILQIAHCCTLGKSHRESKYPTNNCMSNELPNRKASILVKALCLISSTIKHKMWRHQGQSYRSTDTAFGLQHNLQQKIVKWQYMQINEVKQYKLHYSKGQYMQIN